MLLTFSGRRFPNRDPFASAYTCTPAEINRRISHQQRQCRKMNPKIVRSTCIREMKLYDIVGILWAVNICAALSCRRKQMMNVLFYTKFHNVLIINTE